MGRNKLNLSAVATPGSSPVIDRKLKSYLQIKGDGWYVLTWTRLLTATKQTPNASHPTPHAPFTSVSRSFVVERLERLPPEPPNVPSGDVRALLRDRIDEVHDTPAYAPSSYAASGARIPSSCYSAFTRASIALTLSSARD